MDELKIVKMITFSVRIKAKSPENRVFTPFSGHKKMEARRLELLTFRV